MAIILLTNPQLRTPADLALEAWYAARLETGYSDNDQMGTAKEQSGLYGTARDFTQATSGNKPRYRTGILNGKPAYQFDGANYFFSCNQFLTAGDKEMMMVIKIPSPAGSFLNGWCKFDGAGQASHFAFSGTAYSAFGGTNRFSYSELAADMEAGMLTQIACAAGSNNWKWYKNGNTLKTTQTQTIDWGSGTTPRHLLGASSTNPNGSGQSNYWNAYLLELKIWNRLLTTAERNVELTNFSSLYGLTLTAF